MQIFAGEYLQDREKASCGCKFLQESICKIEKRQVADANFCRGVSASREKTSCGCIFLQINRKKHLQEQLTSRCRYNSSKKGICKSI